MSLLLSLKEKGHALSVCCKIVFCIYVSMYINENIYQSYILIFILNEKKPFLLENMVSHIVNKVNINSMVVFVFMCQRLLNICLELY